MIIVQILKAPQIPHQQSYEPDHSLTEAFEGPPTCSNTPLFLEPLPLTRPHKMSVFDEAKKVAAEFEYSSHDLNRGVKEFIRQMGW